MASMTNKSEVFSSAQNKIKRELFECTVMGYIQQNHPEMLLETRQDVANSMAGTVPDNILDIPAQVYEYIDQHIRQEILAVQDKNKELQSQAVNSQYYQEAMTFVAQEGRISPQRREIIVRDVIARAMDGKIKNDMDAIKQEIIKMMGLEIAQSNYRQNSDY